MIEMLVAVATSAALVWFQNTAVADEGLGADDKAGVRESFPIDPRDECLIVPFHIGGQSYRFILDTGFTTTLFDLPFRTDLAIRPAIEFLRCRWERPKLMYIRLPRRKWGRSRYQ